MTTTETALALTVTTRTTIELAAMVGEAHTSMLAAWRVQSECTVAEGYTLEHSEWAINQAEDAQSIFYMLHEQLEARLAADYPCQHLHAELTGRLISYANWCEPAEYEQVMICTDCMVEIEPEHTVPQFDEIQF